MDKILANDMTKLLLIFLVGSLVLFLGLVQRIKSIKGSFQQYQSKTILYLLIALLLFSLVALLASTEAIYTSPGLFFIVFQAYFLLLGAWHVQAMRKNLQWGGEGKSFGTELLFTLLVSIFGCLGFLFLYRLLNKDGLHNIMATSICFFLVPLFVYHTFRKAIEIPPRQFKLWYYPVHMEIAEPDEAKLKNLLVIAFEFRKRTDAKHFTNFRARAPRDMDFGQLFYYFINDYNERHVQSKIQFVSDEGKPFGWIFYKKPKWYSLTTKYIDMENTTFANRIKENDIIMCLRIYENHYV